MDIQKYHGLSWRDITAKNMYRHIVNLCLFITCMALESQLFSENPTTEKIVPFGINPDGSGTQGIRSKIRRMYELSIPRKELPLPVPEPTIPDSHRGAHVLSNLENYVSCSDQ